VTVILPATEFNVILVAEAKSNVSLADAVAILDIPLSLISIFNGFEPISILPTGTDIAT